MKTITLMDFKQYIKKLYEEEALSTNDVLIETDPQSRSSTLEILREHNIDFLKVKKFVNIKEGKLVVDSVTSMDVFTSNDVLTPQEKINESMKYDQLIFVEDNDNPALVNVYKISFNASTNSQEQLITTIPEFAIVKSITLEEFNDNFVNSGLFKEEIDVSLNEQIEKLLINPNIFEAPLWQENAIVRNYDNELAIVQAFKKSKIPITDNDLNYFIYRKGNATIIENINDSSDKKEVSETVDSIGENDIFYFHKNPDIEEWTVHKIEKDLGTFKSEYKAYEYKKLSVEEFENNFRNLKILDVPIIPTQGGFTKQNSNDGIRGKKNEEEKELVDYSISLLTVEAPNPNEPRFKTEIADDSIDKIKDVLSNANQPVWYSLEIINNAIKLIDIKFDQTETVLELPLTQDEIESWNGVLNKHQKVYFSKHKTDVNKVLIWASTKEPNVLITSLECLGWLSLEKFNKTFLKANLFQTPTMNNLKGINLGTNGSELIQSQQPVILPPVIIKDVINLKPSNWGDSLWDLSVINDEFRVDKKFKLEENYHILLNKLIANNNGAQTVILFNKYTGNFLRAYYFDASNKKIDCSKELTDDEKRQLSDIHQKAKSRVDEKLKITVNPIRKNNIISKDTITYRLIFLDAGQKAARWCVEGLDEVGQRGKVSMKLESTDVNKLCSLVGSQNTKIDITFDEDDKFQNISFININHKKITINVDKISEENKELLDKIYYCIIDDDNHIAEDDSMTPINSWNSQTSSICNDGSVQSNIYGSNATLNARSL